MSAPLPNAPHPWARQWKLDYCCWLSLFSVCRFDDLISTSFCVCQDRDILDKIVLQRRPIPPEISASWANPFRFGRQGFTFQTGDHLSSPLPQDSFREPESPKPKTQAHCRPFTCRTHPEHPPSPGGGFSPAQDFNLGNTFAQNICVKFN